MTPPKPQCLLFSCETSGRCRYEDNCDARGFITRTRDKTPEQIQELQESELQALGLNHESM